LAEVRKKVSVQKAHGRAHGRERFKKAAAHI